jgi:hypothetical protein
MMRTSRATAERLLTHAQVMRLHEQVAALESRLRPR